MTKRIGDWIGVQNAGRMYPLDPRADEISIEVIAHALSNLCRFNGHTRTFYSVAEHSCHVHDILPTELKLCGLMHDASEAYLCDLPRPIKRSVDFSIAYGHAEHNLMMVIAWKFGFRWPMLTAVVKADNALLGTECEQLMAPLHPEWRDVYEPVPNLILPCWNPLRARAEFLKRFTALEVGL